MQPQVIDFLKTTAWVQFIIEYHKDVPFVGILPAAIPELPDLQPQAHAATEYLGLRVQPRQPRRAPHRPLRTSCSPGPMSLGQRIHRPRIVLLASSGRGPCGVAWERRAAAMAPPTEAKDDSMNWLLLKPIRPFITLAALASLLLNLALVVPSLYMLQVFDRVFSSRSIETLVMLGLFALLALGLGFCMDRARPQLLARAGRAVDEWLSATALASRAEGCGAPRCAAPPIGVAGHRAAAQAFSPARRCRRCSTHPGCRSTCW